MSQRKVIRATAYTDEPHVEIPEYRTSSGERRIPLRAVERAVLETGDAEDLDYRYATVGDLVIKALGGSSAEGYAFASIQEAITRTTAIELKALAIALASTEHGDDADIEVVGKCLSTAFTTGEAVLMLDVLAGRLEVVHELCDRLSRAGRTGGDSTESERGAPRNGAASAESETPS